MPYSPYLTEKIQSCKQLYNLGTSSNELIESLHDQGLSLTEVCKVIGAVLDIEQAEAHIIVADNPVWVEVVDPSSPVIKEVMQVLDRDGKVDYLGDDVMVFRESVLSDTVPDAHLSSGSHFPS